MLAVFAGTILSYPFLTHAAAVAPIALAPVITSADGAVTIIGQTVEVEPGKKVYLTHTPLQAKIYSWGKGKPTNVGFTLSMQCRDAAGAMVLSAHWAANITPNDSHIGPAVRAMLDQPAGGTFACSLVGYAYSTQAASGMKIGVYPTNDDEPRIKTSFYDNANTWTEKAPAGPGFALAPTKTVKYMGQVLDIPRTAAAWVLVGDGQVSTCKTNQHYKPVCAKASSTVNSSTVQTNVSVTPLKADGVTACGGKTLKGAVKTATIDNNRHHMTLNNSLTIDAATLNNLSTFPAACTKAKVTLDAKVTAGDHAIAHDAYNYAHSISIAVPKATEPAGL